MMKTLTEEEFLEIFKPMKNHFKDEDYVDYVAFDFCMFDTFGKELEYVTSMDKQNRVWTIIETDKMLNYYTCFSTGMHLENRIGYFVCEVPYTEQLVVNMDPFASNEEVHRFLDDYGSLEMVNDDDVLVEWNGQRCYIPDTLKTIKNYKNTFINNEIWEYLIIESLRTGLIKDY